MAKQPSGDFWADYTETYVVGAAVAEAHQRIAVFLPDPDDFPPPADGYPIVITTTAGGFVTTSFGVIIPVAAQVFLSYRILNELGFAVGWVGLTGTYSDLAGTLNTTSNGRGIFHPPGTVGWADDLRYSAQKEAVLAVQLTRDRSSVWGLDPNRIMLDGSSSGATAMQASAFWPDQADAAKADHRRQSSRVRGIRMKIPQTDWYLYDPSAAAPSNFNCFPDQGGDPALDLAPTFGDAPTVPVDYARWASCLRIGLDTAVARTPNAGNLRVWLHSYQGGKNLLDLSLVGEWGIDEGKEPAETLGLSPSPAENRHEAAHAILLARALREVESSLWHTSRSRLVVDQDTYDWAIALDPAVAALINHIQSGSLVDPVLVGLELEWIAGALLDPTPAPELLELPPVDAGDVVDVGLSMGSSGGDLDFLQGDLRRETGLRSAIMVSLFSDARAPAELRPLPDGSKDPRGWWGNLEGEELGSLLWLYNRGKITDETAESMRQAAQDSLSWLVSEGMAAEVRVSATRVGGASPRVELSVEIDRSTAAQWSEVWDAIAAETFERSGLLVTIAP